MIKVSLVKDNNCKRPPHYPPHCGCPAGVTQ
jgi:hypothetical protein